MAQIIDLKLTVEKGSMVSKAKIKANFTVVFTPAEKKLNLQFGLFVMLYEVDFRPDILIPLPNGFNAMRFANLDASMTGTNNTQDDAIGWTKSGIIVPNGRNQLDIELSEEVQLINKNVTNESFRAGVYVSPEISSGFAWSDEVVIPCDPPEPTLIVKDPKSQPNANSPIQASVNKNATKSTTTKTVVKKIVKPKTPVKSTVKKAVVEKTVVKKVIAEKNTVDSVKQESMPKTVTKKPVAKNVNAANQAANTVKQTQLPNKEITQAKTPETPKAPLANTKTTSPEQKPIESPKAPTVKKSPPKS